jgi:hypothetical protein
VIKSPSQCVYDIQLNHTVPHPTQQQSQFIYCFEDQCFGFQLPSSPEKKVSEFLHKGGGEESIHSFHWHVQNATIPCILRSFFFQSSPLHTFSCHSSPSYLTSSCHLFLGLPLGLVDSKFIFNTLLGILFSSILCTCPNQRNLCKLIFSIMVGFLTTA